MKTFAALVALSLLCGCSPPPRTVDYYVEHAGERSEQLGICKSGGAEMESSSNCKNAREADANAIPAK